MQAMHLPNVCAHAGRGSLSWSWAYARRAPWPRRTRSCIASVKARTPSCVTAAAARDRPDRPAFDEREPEHLGEPRVLFSQRGDELAQLGHGQMKNGSRQPPQLSSNRSTSSIPPAASWTLLRFPPRLGPEQQTRRANSWCCTRREPGGHLVSGDPGGTGPLQAGGDTPGRPAARDQRAGDPRAAVHRDLGDRDHGIP
jgi:hypothetical protein